MATVSDDQPATDSSTAPDVAARPAAVSPPREGSWWARTTARLGRSRRSVVSGVLILLALLIASRVFAALSSYKVEPPKKPTVADVYNVRTFTVQPRNYREIVTGFGTARADRQVSVAAEVAGRVIQTHPELEVGTEVRGPSVDRDGDGRTDRDAGELLVQIDPATYTRVVERLQRQLDADDVELDQLAAEERNTERLIEEQQKSIATAQADLDTKKRLLANRAGSAGQVRAAELQVQQYRDALTRLENELSLFEVRERAIGARKASREAELANALLDKDRATVRAPFDGQLSMVNVEMGQYVRPGDAIVSLTDLDHVEIPVALSQSQFERIAPLLQDGQQPTVRLAENETADPRWTGRLVRAAPIATTETRTVDVFVEVDNEEQTQPLLPGTFVHARIDGPILENVVLVPRDALLRDSVFLVAERSNDPDTDATNEEQTSEEQTNASTPDDAAPDDDATASGGPPQRGGPPGAGGWSPDVMKASDLPPAEVPDDAQVALARPVVVARTLQTFALIETGLDPGDRVIITNLDRLSDGRSYVRPADELSIEDELARQRVVAVELIEDN